MSRKKQPFTYCTKCGSSMPDVIIPGEMREYFDALLEAASREHGMSRRVIIGRTRNPEITKVRSAIALILSEHGLLQPQIAALLGNRNRSTIANMLSQSKRDKYMQHRVDKLKEAIR